MAIVINAADGTSQTYQLRIVGAASSSDAEPGIASTQGLAPAARLLATQTSVGQTTTGQSSAGQSSAGQAPSGYQVTEQRPAEAAAGTQATGTQAAATQATGAQTPAETPAEAPDALPSRGTYRITGEGDTMSVFAVSVDAQELLTALADRAGLPLVIDDTVSRRLTINITAKSGRRIMNDIASAYGLSVADVGGITMISEGIPRSPSSYLLSDIDAIRTKYVDASNARNLLPVFLQDYVKVNSEQNAVVLSAPAEVLNKFRQDIAQFDIPAAQILIDLLLVELTDTTLDQLAITLNFKVGNSILSTNPGIGSATFRGITRLSPSFRADIRALQEQGRARVRANPRIATVSGRRASIFVGRQRYVATPIEGGRNYIDAGVRFGITPFTGGEKQVLVDVDSEVSTLSAPDPVTRLPEKSTRTANTYIRVDDGQTIVIGGLRQQESRNIRTKVPLLGDIPVLGPLLFRTKDVRSTQTELVLFITPRILSATGHLPEAEEQALKQRFIESDLSQPVPPVPFVDPSAALSSSRPASPSLGTPPATPNTAPDGVGGTGR